MKTLLALLALSASTAASATCYQIYSPSNELMWQRTTAPVSMDAPSINDEVQKMVPNGHMVIIDDRSTPCPDFDVIKRKTMRERVQEINEIKNQ